MYRLGIYVLQILVILTDHVTFIDAHKCQIGQEHNEDHVRRWVMSYADQCQCTSIIYGGANTITPIRPLTPVYVGEPLITNDVSMIMKHYDLDCMNNCLHQLGMEDGRIDNSQLNASSVWQYVPSWNCGPQNARLNHQETAPVISGAWVAATNDAYQWIQVNLRATMLHVVSGVMIQGRNSQLEGEDHKQYVTKFKVQYKSFGLGWMYVQKLDDQGDMVFDGNTDQNTIVTRLFPSSVHATMIRIRPIEWHGHISMRFDLIGCQGEPQYP